MKNVLLITFLLFSLQINAQQHFIEVEEWEIIELIPITFEYTIIIDLYPGHHVTDDLTNTELIELFNSKCNDVENLISRYGYTSTNSQKSKFEITQDNNFERRKFYSVQFNNEEDLNTFYQIFKDYEGIQGKITSKKYSSPKLIDTLYEPLIKKSKLKAEMLAKIAGRELGQIIEITEIKPQPNDSELLEFMTSGGIIPGVNFSNKDSINQKVIGFKIKFELK